MADRLLLESGSPDGYLLEDGSGVLLMQVPAADAPDVFIRVGTTANIAAPLFTEAGAGNSPTGFGLTASLGTPAITVSSSVSPTGYGLTAGQTAPVEAVTALPAGYGTAVTLGTPTETVGSSVSPTGYGLTASQTAPAEAVDSSVSPAGFGLTAGLGAPTAGVGISVSPTGLEATTALGTVSETVDSTVSPTGVAGTTELGTPSATGGSIVSPTGLGLTAALGTPAVTSDAIAVAPTGLEATMGLGTPTVSGGAPPAPTPQPYGEPIKPPSQRRRVKYQEPVPEHKPAEITQDAVVAVSGFALQARVGVTWQVVDAAIAPVGFQVHAQSSRARATGMHNPTDEQIVEWLIQALTASV